MKNQHISDYLNYYIKLEKPHYAVLLKGKWGSGKTYFIKSLIEQWQEKDDPESETVTLQPIYISLNGITNCNTINDKIKSKISPFLYSKEMKFVKKIASGLLKTATKIDLDFDKDGKADGNITFNIDPISIFDTKSNNISGKKILIFDDVERCKIGTDEIFGYINDFVEHTDCKVILLADENKINEKFENKGQGNLLYKDFKEKIIGQTFEIESDIENAITFFISEIDLSSPSLLLKNQNLIEQIFTASQLENLRVLKQALLDFIRLTNNIEPSLKEEDKIYEDFIKNLLTYFLIVYLEFKTGNEKIIEFQGINFFFDDEDEDIKKLNGKYNELITSNKILYSTFIISIKNILEYIEKGNLQDLNNQIRNCSIYKTDDQKDWEKLWYWTLLEDDEFLLLKDLVWNEFINNKITTTTELLHVSGIFIKLIHEKLTTIKTKRVIQKSKQLLKKSIKEEKITSEHLDYGILHDAWGKEYISRETDEFKDIITFLRSNVEVNQNIEKENYIKQIFDNLTKEKINSIYTLTKTLIPGSTTYYSDTSFLKNINGKQIGLQLKKLDNNSIHKFTGFLHSRFYPEEKYTNVSIEHYHTEEIIFIKNLKSEINLKTKKNKPIKNRLLNKLSNELENIIQKIELKLDK
jgi:hypothetical protein